MAKNAAGSLSRRNNEPSPGTPIVSKRGRVKMRKRAAAHARFTEGQGHSRIRPHARCGGMHPRKAKCHSAKPKAPRPE